MGSSVRNGADNPARFGYTIYVSSEPLELKETWRAQYRATAEALEIVRVQELAAMTDEQALRKILSLRLFAEAPRGRNDWSGLVIQQAIFHRRPIP